MSVYDLHIQSPPQKVIHYLLQLALHMPIAGSDAGDADYPPAEDILGFGFANRHIELRAQALYDGFDKASFVFQTESVMQPKFNGE